MEIYVKNPELVVFKARNMQPTNTIQLMTYNANSSANPDDGATAAFYP